MKNKIIEIILHNAWNFREKAYPHKSGTKVGCALYTNGGHIHGGWNIEGLWMTSIHAEVSAICGMNFCEKIKAIAIVAKTENFTPCGACLDWIVQFASKGCIVITQNKRMEIKKYSLTDLVPFYPKK